MFIQQRCFWWNFIHSCIIIHNKLHINKAKLGPYIEQETLAAVLQIVLGKIYAQLY